MFQGAGGEFVQSHGESNGCVRPKRDPWSRHMRAVVAVGEGVESGPGDFFEIRAAPLPTGQDIMGGGKSLNTMFECLDEGVDTGRRTLGLPRYRLEDRQHVLDAVVQLSDQRPLGFFPSAQVRDIADKTGALDGIVVLDRLKSPVP